MKEFFKTVGAFLRQTWVWSLLLVLFFALFIWFVGPLLAIDDYRFWATSAARLLTLCVLSLAWGLSMVLVNWRAGQRKLAAQGLEAGQLAGRDTEQICRERKDIHARFKRALQVLNTSSLYRGRSKRWRADLPWYLLIGPGNAGKTSFLDFSGVDFPINRIDTTQTRAVKSTAHCEWYYADQGVLIDTAGRYLTQESASVDASAWHTLLRLLRKRRRNRPLNGVLVVIPVAVLQNRDTEPLKKLASTVRARLQDVQQTLRVDLPVYLVLSKADGLPGFDQFFSQLAHEENEQVLGAHFRKDQNGTDATVLRSAFEELLVRINSQLLTRLHQERDPLKRGEILDFPHQLSLIGQYLGRFVAAAFAENDCQPASQLRGVYLTCAPQLEQPQTGADTDTLALGISSDERPVAYEGRPRFMQHLLSRVVFAQADLAGLDKRERSRIRWEHRALCSGALAALVLFGMFWASGFSANYQRLESLRTLAQAWIQQRAALNAGDDALAALEVLDTRYKATQVFPGKSDAGYLERSGLYQGEDVNPVVRAAYERELEEQLLPRVAALLEEQVRVNLKDRERLLNSLRAYLMLNMADRRDTPWLRDWVASEWSQRFAGDTAAQNGLNAHFERLLQQPFIHPLNDQLVTQARQALRSESLTSVVYRMLREQARSLPDYRLSQHLGPQGSLFTGTDQLIPGFYTRRGFEQYFSVQGALMVSGFLKDNWVLGDGTALSAMDMRRLMVELEQLYFRDYSNHWGEALAQVRLSTSSDFAEGAQQLAGLTSASSPILNLLEAVRDNTRFALVGDIVDGAVAGAAKLSEQGPALGGVAAVAASKVAENVASKLPDNAKKSLQIRFEPMHRLLDDNNAPNADLSAALTALNDVQVQMDSLARANSPEQGAFEMARQRMSGQRDALSNLRNTSARLPRPVNGWFNAVAEDAWRLVLSESYHYLNQRYQSELYGFYSKAISMRYPFHAHSASDVAINDFREFFKAQGIAERFFENYMRPFVSGSPGSYRLRSVDGHSLPISRTYLEQMVNVQTIRQSFFANNPAEPQVQFKLEPYTLDPAVNRSEFKLGDKSIEYRHGPIVPMSFVWPVDAEDGRTSLVLDRMIGRPLGIEKNTGPWSLFRLLDLMQTEYLAGRDVMVLKADVGGLRANYLLTSQRMPNPFDMNVLRTFRMPVQL